VAAYVVLARKYRSRTFDEVIGQEPIAQTLVSAIETGRIHHAYLFTGTRGVGKTTMTRILAKALNCLSSDGPTPTPCNTCDACEAISRGDDVDVVEIDGASNRGIDEIRELRANSIYRPARCRYKVYYIDEVHQITRDGFNALLKTLEEPPDHVKFIFATTEPQKVPATILSRCQRFDFRDIPTKRICDHLAVICKSENVQADEDALFRLARAASGSMRDGLSLLDQIIAATGNVTDAEVIRVLGTPADERTLSIARAIADSDAPAALKELDEVLSSGVTLASVAAALVEAFRNMMVISVAGADSELVELPETQRREIAELAGRFSGPALVQALGILESAGRSLRNSSVARAVLEAALVRLADSEKFVDPASLVERLEALALGQKKNPAPAVARGPDVRPAGRPGEKAQSAASASPPQRQVATTIHWEAGWLTANWTTVVEALHARGQKQVAGALRPAGVLGFEGDLLRLGFDANHETIRKRCEERLDSAIRQALAELSTRRIRCEYIRGDSPAPAAGPPPARPAALSTEEKNNIQKDPAIQGVLGLFGGDIVGMERRPQAQAVPAEPADEETSNESNGE